MEEKYPDIEGNPALVYQMTPYEGNALISTVYSSHYTSEISQAQIFMHDGTTLTTIEDSFEAKGSLLRFSKDPILKSYYMDGENRFHYQEFAGMLRPDVVLENKDTNFWKQFFNTNRRLDTLTYGEMQGSHYYGAVLTDPVSKVNSVLGGNITLSTHRLKTHTKKHPDDDYSFNLQLIKASFNQSEQQKILVKKYESLTHLSLDNQTLSFYIENSLYQFFITNKQRLSGRMIYQLTPQGPKTSSSSQEAMLLYLEHKYPQ